MAIGEIAGVVKKQIGTQVYYYGTVTSDKIKNITFVPTIETSKKTYLNEKIEEGYQRPAYKSRMRLFKKYLKENPNSLIPPVLISSRNIWRFEPTQNTHYGKIIIDEPAAIIDGQHRVGGYIALFEEDEDIRPIDFILLEGLDRDTEMKEFLDINTTQRGVPKSLTYYLEAEEPSRLAWALNEEEDSPFKGRITRTTIARENLFALHSVARQIERTFNHGKIIDLDEDTKLDILKMYWTIISDELDEQWADIEKLESGGKRQDFEYKLLELTGLITWSLVAPELLSRSYAEGIGMNWDHVRALVRTCGTIDWRKDGQYSGRTGEVGGAVIAKDMQRLLSPDIGAMTVEEEG